MAFDPSKYSKEQLNQFKQITEERRAIEALRNYQTSPEVTGGTFGGVKYGISPQDAAAIANLSAKAQQAMLAPGKADEARMSARIQADKEIDVVKRKPTAERKGEADALSGSIDAIFGLYDDAYREVEKDLPNIGEPGIAGWFDRQKAKLGASTFFEKYPKLGAYEDSVKAFATDFAKSAGEVRPTDVDIERFAKTLFTVTKGSRERNLQKAKNQITMMKAKGVSVVWANKMLEKVENSDKQTGNSGKMTVAELRKKHGLGD